MNYYCLCHSDGFVLCRQNPYRKAVYQTACGYYCIVIVLHAEFGFLFNTVPVVLQSARRTCTWRGINYC